ncbi:hypothetical protein P7C70_g1880, partial [Phenoliferia sp. Uapishka_3]
MVSLDIDPVTGAPTGVNRVPFHLEDFPIDNAHRRLKIAMIGAGFSGIIAGVRIPQRLKNVDLSIFEKNYSVREQVPRNCLRHPSPLLHSHFRTKPKLVELLCLQVYYFASLQNTNTDPTLPKAGSEILQYLKDVSAKYKLDKYLRYGHCLKAANWDEKSGQWTLQFDILNEAGEKVGEKSEVADVVIQGMGGLSRWDWPVIPGLEDFKGTKLHTAAYEGVASDQQDKKVAVIGSGSSAIQIVPTVQPFAKQIDNYVRGSTWIAAPFASKTLLQYQPDGRNYKFTDEDKKLFAEDPVAFAKFRRSMEDELNSVHQVTLKGSPMQVGAVTHFREDMEKKLKTKPEILSTIIPTFPVACRRLTPGPGYLEALVEDNAGFVSSPIKTITATGIETVDGVHREYDTIICATGFDTSYKPRTPIIGRNGVNVQDLWADIPTSYLSIAIGPDHPNYFVVNGPNSSVGSGSLLVMFEREVDYIIAAISKMQRENIKAMSVKQSAVDDFMEFIANYFPKTVYSEKCRSWYKKGMELGPVVALWPGSCLHAITAMKNPRWEDFDYTPVSQKNRFTWLGNGQTNVEETGEGDRAFYLTDIDIPPVPLQ